MQQPVYFLSPIKLLKALSGCHVKCQISGTGQTPANIAIVGRV